MKRKLKIDLMDIVERLKKQLIQNRPTIAKMYQDIRMMNFVIRPVQGDITSINLKNERLIEALWSLGKLDEFFQTKFKDIPKNQKEVFVNLVNNLHKQFQLDLNKANLTLEKPALHPILEMEIFKKQAVEKKSN